jgi:hypothetical protein
MDGVFHPHTSVIWDIVSREIRVSTDGGRLIRPFYKLGEDGSVPEVKEGAQWHELITDGTMEYLDVEEAAFTSSLRPEEHRTGKDRLYGDPSEFGSGRAGELHPVSGSQPVPPKQLPIGYGKQAVGLHTLLPPPHGYWYSRHGLRTTTHREQQSGRMMGCRDACINVIVAISTRGYNQEDAVINKTCRARSVHEHH